MSEVEEWNFPILTIKGQLEIDYSKGVIWFNSNEGICKLRISKITPELITKEMMDITYKE